MALLAMALEQRGAVGDLVHRIAVGHPHQRSPLGRAHHRGAAAPHRGRAGARQGRHRRRLPGHELQARDHDARSRRLGHDGGGARGGARRPSTARSAATSTASTRPIRASCPRRKRLDAVSYDEMQEMAEHGAKVLNAQAVEWAKKEKIVIYARATTSAAGGDGKETRVGEAVREQRGAIAVTGTKQVTIATGDVLAICEEEGIALRHASGAGIRFVRDDVPDWPRVEKRLQAQGRDLRARRGHRRRHRRRQRRGDAASRARRRRRGARVGRGAAAPHPDGGVGARRRGDARAAQRIDRLASGRLPQLTMVRRRRCGDRRSCAGAPRSAVAGGAAPPSRRRRR